MSFANQIEKNLLDLYLGKPMNTKTTDTEEKVMKFYWQREPVAAKRLRCHCGSSRPEYRGVCYDCAVFLCHQKRHCPVDRRSEQQIRDEFLELLHE